MNKKQRKHKQKKIRVDNAAKKAGKAEATIRTESVGEQYLRTESAGPSTQPSDDEGENWMPIKEWMRLPSSSNWVIAGLTFILAGIALLQALIYCGQLHAMHVDQRPWMKFVNADKTVPLNRSTTIMGAAQITNPGRTPARNVRVELVVEKVKNGEQPKLSLGSDESVSKTGLAYPQETEPSQGIPFGMRGDSDNPFDFIPLGDDYDRWTKGEIFLSFMGGSPTAIFSESNIGLITAYF